MTVKERYHKIKKSYKRKTLTNRKTCGTMNPERKKKTKKEKEKKQ